MSWSSESKRAIYFKKKGSAPHAVNKTCLYWQTTHVSRTTLACVNESAEDLHNQALSGHVTEFTELNKVSVNFTLESTVTRNFFTCRRWEWGQPHACGRWDTRRAGISAAPPGAELWPTSTARWGRGQSCPCAASRTGSAVFFLITTAVTFYHVC